MKANLMFRDRDFDLKANPCFGEDTLTADLELKCILLNMAQGDEIINAACSTALFCTLQSIEEIRYRQENLRDAFRNPDPYGNSMRLLSRRRRKEETHGTGCLPPICPAPFQAPSSL